MYRHNHRTYPAGDVRGAVLLFILLTLVSCSTSPTSSASGEVKIIATDPVNLSTQAIYTPTTQLSPQSSPSPIAKTPTTSPSETPPKSRSSTSTPTPRGQSTPSPTSTIIQIPAESSGLLFINDEGLMRWDYYTNYVSPISGGVRDFSINDDGRIVALLRTKNMVANGVEMFELSILDFDTKHIQTLIENTPRLFSLSMSPDGKWIAFYTNKNGGRLKTISTDGNNRLLELGFCHQSLDSVCEAVSWSPDSSQVLWGDQRGLWLSDIEQNSPRLVAKNTLQAEDPGGDISEIQVDYSGITWSPAGRFALARVTPSTSATHWFTLVDTRRGISIELPGTFQPEAASTNTSWLNNGELVVGLVDTRDGDLSLIATIYEIIPTHRGLARMKNSFHIESEDLPEVNTIGDEPHEFYMDWIDQPNLQSEKINFAVVSRQKNVLPVLFSLDVIEEEIQTLNIIPISIQEIYWAADDSGALLVSEDHINYFAPFNGETILNLSQVFGENAQRFTWLPSTPR